TRSTAAARSATTARPAATARPATAGTRLTRDRRSAGLRCRATATAASGIVRAAVGKDEWQASEQSESREVTNEHVGVPRASFNIGNRARNHAHSDSRHWGAKRPHDCKTAVFMGFYQLLLATRVAVLCARSVMHDC